jgi:hypothetical protein
MLAELTSSDGKAGRASGKVLFYSTLGSVAGGVLTPVYLFPWLGVARSTYFVCAVLALAGCMLAIDRLHLIRSLALGSAAVVAGLCVHVLTSATGDRFAFDSAYQSIRIVDEKNEQGRTERVMLVGGGRASAVYADTGETSLPYTRLAERLLRESGAKNALVIGAAGFTFPRDAAKLPGFEQVDAVDVDPSVLPIAEQHFLMAPLPPQVRFLPLSARFAVRKLRRDGRHYQFTFVDAYFGKGIPAELVTTEFFDGVRAISDHTVANAVIDRATKSVFARNLFASFRAAFGRVWLIDARPKEDSDLTNMLILNWPATGSKEWNGRGEAYRDDRNDADRDRVAMIWGDDSP